MIAAIWKQGWGYLENPENFVLGKDLNFIFFALEIYVVNIDDLQHDGIRGQWSLRLEVRSLLACVVFSDAEIEGRDVALYNTGIPNLNSRNSLKVENLKRFE